MHLLATPDPNPGRAPRREVVAPVSLEVNNVAAPHKINSYRQQYSDNQNISFLPAIVSTRTRMHGKFLRLLFLQAHRETEAYFTLLGFVSARTIKGRSTCHWNAMVTQPIGG
jgi:hypothetical protein